MFIALVNPCTNMRYAARQPSVVLGKWLFCNNVCQMSLNSLFATSDGSSSSLVSSFEYSRRPLSTGEGTSVYPEFGKKINP